MQAPASSARVSFGMINMALMLFPRRRHFDIDRLP
jgi:hypothetical protein